MAGRVSLCLRRTSATARKGINGQGQRWEGLVGGSAVLGRCRLREEPKAPSSPHPLESGVGEQVLRICKGCLFNSWWGSGFLEQSETLFFFQDLMASKSQHNAPKTKSLNGKAESQGQWGRAW